MAWIDGLMLRPARLLAFILASASVTGCAWLQQPSSNVIVRDGVSGDVSPADIANGKLGEEVLGEVQDFALMSAAVYSNDASLRSVCDADLELTEGRFRSASPRRVPYANSSERPGRPLDGGSGRLRCLGLVRRGGKTPRRDRLSRHGRPRTRRLVRKSTMVLADSLVHLRSVRPSPGFIPHLVDEIKGRYGQDVQVIADRPLPRRRTGTQVAYASPDIGLVYAFDPSIVTGYYDVDPPERRTANSKGIHIYRVYEHGEILAYLRWLMKKVYPLPKEDPKIVEVRYNLTEGGMYQPA